MKSSIWLIYHKWGPNSHCWRWKCLKSSEWKSIRRWGTGGWWDFTRRGSNILTWDWEFMAQTWVFHQDAWATVKVSWVKYDEFTLGACQFYGLYHNNIVEPDIFIIWTKCLDFNSKQDQRFKALPLVKMRKPPRKEWIRAWDCVQTITIKLLSPR